LEGCELTEKLSITIELPTGKKTLQFTPLNLVPIGIIRRTRDDNTEQMWQIFEWSLYAKDLAVLDQAPATQLWDILGEMQKISQADLGESEASPTSSKSTARRSKPTSSTSD
jgi:hypothetical protein